MPNAKYRLAARWILASSAVLGLVQAVRAENWPQWRGPAYDGISKETGLPAEWSDSKNIAWKLDLPGRSGATPAIWADRIFLNSMDGADVVLVCVSTDGRQLWKRKLGTGTPKRRGRGLATKSIRRRRRRAPTVN